MSLEPAGQRHRPQGSDTRPLGRDAESAGKYGDQPQRAGRESAGRRIPYLGCGCSHGDDDIRPQPGTYPIRHLHAGAGKRLPAYALAALERVGAGRSALCRRLALCLFQRQNAHVVRAVTSVCCIPCLERGKRKKPLRIRGRAFFMHSVDEASTGSSELPYLRWRAGGPDPT